MPDLMEGVRVLDMTIFQQGTYPGAMFADMGADVIKIEGPDSPDPGRFGANFQLENYNAYFESLNRGKRGIALDLKDERGRAVFHKLVETADIFVSNMRRPALKKLGADYETLKKINPRIIYGRASAYGPKGPDSDQGGMDILGQARGGMMSVTGEPDGPPKTAGAAIADHVGALTLAFGLMSALYYREHTGEGQELDASLLGGQLCIQTHAITYSLWSGKESTRRRRNPNPTWNPYKGSDGKWFCLGMSRDSYWPGICRFVGKPEWLTDPRFANQDIRMKNGDELYDMLQEIFLTKTAAEWIRGFNEHNLLATPVNTYHDMLTDPQIMDNEYIVHIPEPNGGAPLPMVSVPVTFGKTPTKVRGLAPQFGQNTEEVMLEAGYEWEEIAALRDAGVIGARATEGASD